MKLKHLILTLSLTATALMAVYPNFHPEQAVLDHYYWQADILIHGGYYFGLTLLILILKIKIKPFHLFLALTSFSFLLEGLQFFSFNRGVSFMDLGSNLLGIGAVKQ
jgi:VanZ family protein